jgi:CRP-like cAMP-binding protein
VSASIEFLATTDLMKDIAGQDLEVVADAMVERKVDAGENILAENDASCSLYLLREGHVRISIGYPLNLKSDLPIRTLCAGEIFGEFAFIDRLPRSASAFSVTDVQVLVLSREAFDRLAAEKPALALALIQNIATTLTERIRDITALWRDSI